MPARNFDLHGSAPEKCSTALLLIDVINAFEFDGAERLLPAATVMSHALARLKRAAERHGIPCIYVNDYFGRWRSDFQTLVSHCLEQPQSREIAERLQPQDEGYFILKPKHSGFFSTALETLLTYLGTRTLVLTGFTAHKCVFFTAADAFVRDDHVIIPTDCVASPTLEERDAALAQMQAILKVKVCHSTDLHWDELTDRVGTRVNSKGICN